MINNLKKSIYDCLSSQETLNFTQLHGIFTYVDKNELFPYICISVDDIEDNSNFNKNIYKCRIVIDIYDKNVSVNFATDLSEEIKEIFKNKSNFTSEYFSIIDILFNKIDISLENNKIWKIRVFFEFIISCN